MGRSLGVLRIGLLGLTGLLVFAALAFYIQSERILNRQYEVAAASVAVSSTPEDIAEGERLAAIAGCSGCHGDQLEGGTFFEGPWLGTIVSPDLTRVAANHTDAELEGIIRRGIRKDGTSVLVMPSEMFAHMTDSDLGKILAFIRSRPVGDGPETRLSLRLARVFLVLGEFQMATERIDAGPWPHQPGPSDPEDWGRYLAMTACTECHGTDLAGADDGTTPDLAIAAPYSLEEFQTLMRTGVPKGGHELDLMAEVARGRFVHFTNEEVTALHGYLRARAGA